MIKENLWRSCPESENTEGPTGQKQRDLRVKYKGTYESNYRGIFGSNIEGPIQLQRGLRVIEESRVDTRLDFSQNNKWNREVYAYEWKEWISDYMMYRWYDYVLSDINGGIWYGYVIGVTNMFYIYDIEIIWVIWLKRIYDGLVLDLKIQRDLRVKNRGTFG